MANQPLTVTTAADEALDEGEILNSSSTGTTTAGGDTTDLSLREAIGLAQEGDTIIFDASLNGQTLTLGGSELTITKGLTIDGDMDSNGTPDITIDANNASRVFNISSSSALNGLTITGGNVAGSGGGINSSVDLTISNSVITGNKTTGDQYAGGGVHAPTLSLTNTTVSANSTAGIGAVGGGMSGNNVTLTNSTVSGNSTAGNHASGGGVHGSTITLTNSTVTGNSTTGQDANAGGVNTYITTTLNNSIILGNDSAQTPDNEITGFVLPGENSVNIVGTGTDTNGSDGIINADPAAVFANTVANGSTTAGVLAYNGGTVQTIALKADVGNPALDVGTAPPGVFTDANGNARDVDIAGVAHGPGTVDAGAVELQVETPSLTVTTANDVVDTFDGQISLREAIAHANNTQGVDTITFDGALSGSTITLGGTELIITEGVTIDGDLDDNRTPDITIDANQQSRVLNISGETGSTLDGLTITGGNVVGSGGGINSTAVLSVRNSVVTGNQTSLGSGGPGGKEGGPPGASASYGGGIATTRTLDITNSTISNNTTTGDGGFGGGILARGATTLTNSTVSGNSTSGDNAKGGGLYTNATINLSNTTISGNSTAGADSRGGGINTFYDVTLSHSTISGNSTAGANSGGGGIATAADLILTNSIVLGNDSAQTADNENEVHGSLSAYGVSIVGTGSDTDASDGIINADPVTVFANIAANGSATTGVLTDNGGTVQTIALRADASNPALDVGTAPGGVTTDATGNSRSVDLAEVENEGGPVDAGAVELQALGDQAPTITGTGTNAAFTEGDDPVVIFNITDINTIEAGQTISTLVMVHSGHNVGADDKITIDGTVIPLVNGETGTTAGSHSIAFNVTEGIQGKSVELTGMTISAEDLKTVLNAVTYENTSENPDGIDHIFSISALVDSGSNEGANSNNASGDFQSQITVTPVDDDPTITVDSTPLVYTVGDAPVQIDAAVTVVDPESNWDGGRISAYLGNGIETDNVTLDLSGTVTINGNQVQIGETTVGTINVPTGTTGISPLVVTLNDQATSEHVTAIAQAFQYGSGSTSLDATQDKMAFISAVDGDGVANIPPPNAFTVVRTIDVQDKPVVTPGGGSNSGGGSSSGGGNTPAPEPQPVVVRETDDANNRNDTLNGAALNDTLEAGGGDDSIDGGAGADLIKGGEGNDNVVGGSGNDQIFAGAGDTGNDTLQGNLGNDILGGGAGSDFIIGGDARPNLDVNALDAAGDDTLFGGEGDDFIVGGSFDTATQKAVETGSGDNTIWAGVGDDTVFGDGQNDVIGGGAGNDRVNSGGGNDILYGGKGDPAVNKDELNGGDGKDQIFASVGEDTVTGGTGDDILFGGADDDTIDGGADNDQIWGGAGNDNLAGGSGDDTFSFAAGFGADTITDFGASEGNTDVLDLSFIEGLSLAGLQSSAVTTSEGTTLSVGDNDTILLAGIDAAALQAIFDAGQVSV